MPAAAPTLSIDDAMTVLSAHNCLERLGETLATAAAELARVRGVRHLPRQVRRLERLAMEIFKEANDLDAACFDAQVVLDDSDGPFVGEIR